MSGGASTAPQRRYFMALDAFRGLCALLVAAGHLRTGGFLSTLPMLQSIGYWVDFFFVLSGFVIAYSAHDALAAQPARAIGFMVRRVGRVWPLHMVMLLGVFAYQLLLLFANHRGLVADPVAFSERASLAWLPLNIAMVQAWGLLPFPSWNIPAWSISAEFAAYLIFAVVMALLGRRGRWAILLIGVGCGALMLWLTPTGMRSDASWAVPRCLFGFSAGVMVHWLWAQRPERTIVAADWLEPLCFVAAFAAVPLIPSRFAYAIVPLFAVMVWLFAHEAGWLSRMLRGQAGQLLGRQSYSIYIVHFLVATLLSSAAAVAPHFGISFVHLQKFGHVSGIGGAPWAMDVLLLIYSSFVVAIGMMTFRWIEDPARQWAARCARRLDRRFGANKE